MSGRLAWARRVGLVIIGLLGGSAVALWLAVRVQLPSSEAPSLPGLTSPVEVSFDARAIPTVRANALLDAIRVQGYLVARERFFQMELQRRAARGELAELLGKATLPIDRLHRVYGFRQVAEESLQHLPSDQRAALEAYAAGVNAFLRARPERLGLELALLRTSPRRLLAVSWSGVVSRWAGWVR